MQKLLLTIALFIIALTTACGGTVDNKSFDHERTYIMSDGTELRAINEIVVTYEDGVVIDVTSEREEPVAVVVLEHSQNPAVQIDLGYEFKSIEAYDGWDLWGIEAIELNPDTGAVRSVIRTAVPADGAGELIFHEVTR